MRVSIVCDNQRQKLALSETVDKMGSVVVATLGSESLLSAKLPSVDVWLIDIDNYSDDMQERVNSTSPKSVVMGFEKAPHFTHYGYKRWQRALTRKLAQSLNADLPKRTFVRAPQRPWHYVLFLGASMGGPDAIKVFLDHIDPSLPLAVIIAHHFNEHMLDGLPAVLTRHNQWRCKIINMTQSLQAGTCLIAPIDKQIICDSNGRVILTKKDWNSDYKPHIGQLIKNASEVYGSMLIGIIFSGMGSDGSQYAKELVVNRSHFWAQEPTTCQSPSQPMAFINTGVCEFVGSPLDLAERVNRLLSPYTNTLLQDRRKKLID